MRRALVIVGKAPAAGTTKTRLVPPLSPDEAAALYRGFLLDTVGGALELGWERVTVVHPRGCHAALTELLPADVHVQEQCGHGLGAALPFAFEHHLAEGFSRVILIGSDSPTLAWDRVEKGCVALDSHELSIGPSLDGGYYLIGMRDAHLGVFDDIDWSTARVYRQTLAHARRLGLRVCALDDWYDVDDIADLERLQRDLRALPGAVAPNTRAALSCMTLAAVTH